MILKVLFGQRIESYEGEYAPEALAIADEYTDDDNPDYLLNELKKCQEDESFENLIMIEIEVDDEKIDSFLRPINKIKGKIK